MFHATPGALPSDGALEIPGISLPPGRLVTARDGRTVAWISTEPLRPNRLEALVRALAAMFPQTGLWPLQAKGEGERDLDRPWNDGELRGPVGEVPDALPVLLRAGAEHAAEYGDGGTELPVPPVTVPAAAQPGPDLTAAQLELGGAGGLLLVPVARPADVPAALGWFGATNLDLRGADLTAVLRSWEDRFGAVLVSIGFDTLLVQVARRPRSGQQLDALLSEHYTFCPDNIEQGLEPDEYRQGLTEWSHWHFWWD